MSLLATRHNAYRKQTTSLCKNHQKLSSCGFHPWAEHFFCTLPVCGNTRGNLRRLAKSSRKLHREARHVVGMPERGPGFPCGTLEELLTKGGEEPTGQNLPTGGWLRTAVRAFYSWDLGSPTILPLNIGRHLLGHVMLLNLLFSGSSKRIRKREMSINLSFLYLMSLKTDECFSHLEI